jgi:hypothetical protein
MIMGNAKDTMDAIFHEVELFDAEQRNGMDDEAQWAESLSAQTRARLAMMRRHRVATIARGVAPVDKVEIPPSLFALTRDALLTRLHALLGQPDQEIQVAYRDLQHRADDDLRVLVTLLERSEPEGAS